MEITKEKLAELKELAEKATLGPWRTACKIDEDDSVIFTDYKISKNKMPKDYLVGYTNFLLWRAPGGHIKVVEVENRTHWKDDAAYIAAANPKVMLALIADFELLRDVADFQDKRIESLERKAIAFEKEKNDLKAKIVRKTKRIKVLEDSLENLRRAWREPYISGLMKDFRMGTDVLYAIIKRQDREIARLEREADQLAKYLADSAVEGNYEDAVAYWRETARKAVEETCADEN